MWLNGEKKGRDLVVPLICFRESNHLTILLKRFVPRLFLLDEVHTYMRLSIDMVQREVLCGPLLKIVAETHAKSRIEKRAFAILLEPSDEQCGDVLNLFIQSRFRSRGVSLKAEHSQYCYNRRPKYFELMTT